MTDVEWPVPIRQNYYQFSYRIVESGGTTLHTIASLREATRVADENVKNVVWTGWSMFHPFTRKEIAPYVVIDSTSGEEIEAIETSLLGETFLDTTLPDFWRITADGRTTIFRAYREDRAVIERLARQSLMPGKWFSPHTLVREVYELVTHAKEFAKTFPHADRIEFRCSWLGLKGRKVAEFLPVHWNDRTCRTSERTTAATASIDEVTADVASVVLRLAGPVLTLFDGYELTRDWIVGQVPKFHSL